MNDIKNLKKGDEILLIKSMNGLQHWEGKILTVINTGQGYLTAVPKEDTKKGAYSIYYHNDEFVKANKASYIAYYSNKIEQQKKILATYEAELEFHEKYDSMEEYVADKLIAIMKTDNKTALVEMLKTLKQTNFL